MSVETRTQHRLTPQYSAISRVATLLGHVSRGCTSHCTPSDKADFRIPTRTDKFGTLRYGSAPRRLLRESEIGIPALSCGHRPKYQYTYHPHNNPPIPRVATFRGRVSRGASKGTSPISDYPRRDHVNSPLSLSFAIFCLDAEKSFELIS